MDFGHSRQRLFLNYRQPCEPYNRLPIQNYEHSGQRMVSMSDERLPQPDSLNRPVIRNTSDGFQTIGNEFTANRPRLSPQNIRHGPIQNNRLIIPGTVDCMRIQRPFLGSSQEVYSNEQFNQQFSSTTLHTTHMRSNVPPAINSAPFIRPNVPPVINPASYMRPVVPPAVNSFQNLRPIVPSVINSSHNVRPIVPPVIDSSHNLRPIVPHFINSSPSMNPITPPVINSFLFDSSNISGPGKMIPGSSLSDQVLASSNKMDNRNDDISWVKDFVNNNKNDMNVSKMKTISISEFQSIVKRTLNLRNDIILAVDAIDNADSSNEQFSRICAQIETLKELVDFISNEDQLKKVSMLVKKRKLKRARLKRLRERRYREAVQVEEKRAEKQRQITAALEAKAQELMDAKQKQEMKIHADSVQAEVRKKLSDSERTIELLRSLRKLRKARLNSVVSRGINANMSLHETFELKIQKLQKFVQERKSVYESESKTLEVMLDRENIEIQNREREDLTKYSQELLKKKVDEVEEQLFGCEALSNPAVTPFLQYYSLAESCLDSLISVRNSWDVYVVPSDLPGSSRIPDGWVVPELPSNKSWNRFMHK